MMRIFGRAALTAGMLAAVFPIVLASPSPVAAASATVTCDPQPSGGSSVAAPMLSYTPINPVRLVDTRNNIGGVRAPIDRGCTMIVDVRADIPTNAQAVALSMTAVNSEADYFTVYPCANGRPDTSNLNARAGFATPNLVVAIPDPSGRICIFSHGRSDLIVDLSGWWSDGPNRFGSIAPERVYDSRQAGFTALAPNEVRQIRIPTTVIPAGSTAAVINLTAANGVRAGFMTAFRCGQPIPNASNANFLAGEARAVGAIVGLGADNIMCVVADTTVHVIVDVNGYYAPAPGFGPVAVLEPTPGRRVVDTRNGIGGPRLPLAAGEVRSFDPVAGLPDAADATAVMLNFVSTDAAGPGFLTAYRCGGSVPNVSTLNYVTGEAATNLAAIELGSEGRVCIVSSVATNVIVDVFGVMTAPPGSPLERLSFDKPAWPPFNAAATDYVIECRAGAGTANVAMDLDLLPFTSARLSVAGGPATPVGTGSVSFPLRTDQPVVVETTRQGVARNYHFRCVPLDFPRLEVLRPGNPSPGWYLTTSGFASPNPAVNGPFLMILDHYGAPVWYKRTPSGMMDAKRLSDGRIAFTPSEGPFGIREAQGYWLTDLAGAGTVKHRTTNPAPSALPTDHHDYIELPGVPNRRAHVSYPIVTAPGDLGFGGPFADRFSDGVIQEVDENNSQVWRWDMSDHFDPADSTFPINFATTPGFEDKGWDVFHINAIDRVEPGGDYLVTVRHMDGVFLVDRETKHVEWTLGTPRTRDPQPTGPVAPQLNIVGDPFGGPKRPHDGRLNGNILTMLDNQVGTGNPSRAVAYEINGNTATFLWHHTNAAPGGATLGSAQQTDDSVVINWGAGLQPFLEERAFNGQRLMAVGLPNSGQSYRTIKYLPATFDVGQLRTNAGGSVATPP
jgi:hypothetical protein